MARPLRVRPSEPRDKHFEDFPVSINASKDGIYFKTKLKSYYPGMRLFVTFPFTSAHDPLNGYIPADTTLAAAELGHAPRFSIEEGLRRTLEWYRGAEKAVGSA